MKYGMKKITLLQDLKNRRPELWEVYKKYKPFYSRRWSDKQKLKIRFETNVLISKGILKKPLTCQRCCSHKRAIHVHHIGYNDPKKVEWLCSICHVREHVRMRSIAAAYQFIRDVGGFRKKKFKVRSGS